MRKFVLSAVFAFVVMAASIIPAFASSIGPTP
jgi:hypothetical protein